MKTILLVFALFSSAAAFSQSTPRFAQSGRLLTVEFWSHHEATVWVVQSERIVVYRTFDTQERDLLVGQFPISPKQARRMREATAAIPQSAYGTLFWQGGLLHGPLLRLSFTPDGTLAGTRIELCGVFEEWLRPLCASISDAVPGMSKIEFEAAVEERRDLLAKTGNVPPTIWTPIADYYAGLLTDEEKQPNQPPQRNAGIRPSSGDSSAFETPSSLGPRG